MSKHQKSKNKKKIRLFSSILAVAIFLLAAKFFTIVVTVVYECFMAKPLFFYHTQTLLRIRIFAYSNFF